MSGDPGMSMRKLRQNAIEKSAKIVIEDTSEDLQSGWTLTTPHLPNSLRTMPFEEVVLLITDAALYAVRFDWNLEKVTSFERIDLLSISAVMRGVYITNTLANSQIDQKRNVGFVIQYKPGIKNVERVNTRSMSTANALRGTFEVEKAKGDESTSTTDFAAASNEPTSPSPNTDEKGQTQELKFLAFKALPARSSYTLNRDSSEVATVSERRLVRNICGEIAKAAGKDPIEWVKEKDIISLAEARKSTGYLEQLGYSLKKLVWA